MQSINKVLLHIPLFLPSLRTAGPVGKTVSRVGTEPGRSFIWNLKPSIGTEGLELQLYSKCSEHKTAYFFTEYSVKSLWFLFTKDANFALVSEGKNMHRNFFSIAGVNTTNIVWGASNANISLHAFSHYSHSPPSLQLIYPLANLMT